MNAPSKSARLACIAVAFQLLAPAAGCSVHTEGVADLVNDRYSYTAFPGQRLIDSPMAKYGVDWKADGSMLAIGIQTDGTLALAGLTEAHHCTMGQVADFVPAVTYYGSAARPSAAIPVLRNRDSEGWATLAFVSDDCAVQRDAAEHAKFLDVLTPYRNPPLFIAQARPPSSGDPTNLLACDPAAESKPCSAIGAYSIAEGMNDWLWSIELHEGERRLVLRNSALELDWVAGTAVSEFVVGAEGQSVAFADTDGLHLADGTTRTVIDLTDDACELKPALSLSVLDAGFSYRSPCLTGPLFLFDPETEQSFALAAGATAPILLESDSKKTHVAFYVLDAADVGGGFDPLANRSLAEQFRARYGTAPPAATGTLAATTVGGDTVLGPNQVWLAGLLWTYASRMRLLTEFDGQAGELVEWDIAHNTTKNLVAAVSDFGWDWAIANRSANGGDFVTLDQNAVPRVLAHNVLDRGVEYYNACMIGSIDCLTRFLASPPDKRQVILSEFDGRAGRLILLSRSSYGVPLSISAVLDEGVSPNALGFLYGGDAVVYLRDVSPDDGAGTLTTTFVNTLDTFHVDGVNSWRQVDGPNPGLLYSVPQGAKAGLWFAALY